MVKRKNRFFVVCLTEALGKISVVELDDREHFDNVRMSNQQMIPGVNRLRNAAGLSSCGVTNIVGMDFDALVLFEGGTLSIRDQLRAEKMCEDQLQ